MDVYSSNPTCDSFSLFHCEKHWYSCKQIAQNLLKRLHLRRLYYKVQYI